MSYPHFRLPRFITLVAALVLPLMLDSCSSSKKKMKGVPANLPVIPIQGSAATPSHSMSHREYPFDSGGNYVSAWAAEGERSAGRGSAASSDYAEWKSSHHGETRSSASKEKKTASTARKKPSRESERTPLSPPIKITSTSSKKTSNGVSKKTPATVSTASKSTPKKSTATPAKKSVSGGSYKVKKGDTLFSIARKSGTTVAKIKAANGLKSDIIRDGQTLTISK